MKKNYLHREIKGHEFTNGFQTSQRSSDSHTSESHFRDWSVDDSLLAEFVQESF
jgi:hypothetical protein